MAEKGQFILRNDRGLPDWLREAAGPWDTWVVSEGVTAVSLSVMHLFLIESFAVCFYHTL